MHYLQIIELDLLQDMNNLSEFRAIEIMKYDILARRERCVIWCGSLYPGPMVRSLPDASGRPATNTLHHSISLH